MADLMLADRTVSATDLKRRGLASLPKEDTGPVAIVKNNRATHYVITAAVFERILARLEAMEDAELHRIADARMNEPRHRVTLDDL
jgi:antitoxin StbD